MTAELSSGTGELTGGPDGSADNDAESKSARKKREKLERRAAWRVERRKVQKSRTLETKQRAAEERERVPLPRVESGAMPAHWAKTTARNEMRYLRREARSLMSGDWEDASVGCRVLIDAAYDHLMTPAEIKSLVQQIVLCYSENIGRFPRCRPFRLALGAETGGPVLEELRRRQGCEQWLQQVPPLSVNSDNKRLVFLSPDAEEPLTELDDTAIYVIGGLVDYQRTRCASLTRARGLGAAVARLPIVEHASDLGGGVSCDILSLNQVLIALLELRSKESGGWAHALRCAVPSRKLRTAGGGKQVAKLEVPECQSELGCS